MVVVLQNRQAHNIRQYINNECNVSIQVEVGIQHPQGYANEKVENDTVN